MIQIEGLSKTYHTQEEEIPVLEDISLSLPDKGFVAILGDSGSGKTTFLNILGLLDRDFKGRYLFDGKDVSQLEGKDLDSFRNHKIGFVFQDFVLVEELSVRDNILLSFSGKGRREAEEKVDSLLSSIGLSGFGKRKAKNLSGGEKQRVAILRAIVNSPRVLLADEPTGSLDNRNSKVVADILKAISKDRLVVMVTHNRELATDYADMIVTIADGKTKTSGMPIAEQSQPVKDEEHPFSLALRKILSLSSAFLFGKKVKTILTSIGLAISVFGLTLILAIYSGFQSYVSNLEEQILKEVPLVIEEIVLPSSTLATSSVGNTLRRDDENAYLTSSVNTMYSTNAITDDFVNYMRDIDPSLLSDMKMRNGLAFNLVSLSDKTGNVVTTSKGRDSFLSTVFSDEINFKELPSFTEDILGQYDVYGSYPEKAGEMAIVLEGDNSIGSLALSALGIDFPSSKKDGYDRIDFDTILSHKLKLIPNDDYYVDITDPYNPIETNGIFLKRQYDLQNDGLSLYSLLDMGLSENMSREDFDEELMRKLIQYVDLPSYAKDIDSVDFTDEDEVEDFFLSLFQTKDLSLYRTMTEQEKKDYLLDETKGLAVSITAILKPKKEAFLPSLRSGVYYTPAFAEYVLENNSPSFVDENRNGKIDPEEDHRCAIAKSYEDNIYLTFDGTGHLVTRSILDSATEGSDVEQYLTNRRFFGVDNTISSITIYPKDFQAKKKIVDYIDAYNERLMEQGKDSIKTTDLPEMIFSNLEMVLDIIFLILILFTSISLVVAVFLIASILYANVLEKTREIGLFRALGFGKRHVFFIFALMSVLLGLISGVLGVILGYLSTLAVNALAVSFFPYYGVEHIAVLPPLAAFLLVLLSIFLALLSSLVPSLVASRKDPVRSLRGN